MLYEIEVCCLRENEIGILRPDSIIKAMGIAQNEDMR